MITKRLISLIFILFVLFTLHAGAQELNWIVVGDDSGYVHSLYYQPFQQPQLIWKAKVANNMIGNIKIADLDNDGFPEIVVFAFDEKIYCLEAETGAVLWSYSSPWKDFERYRGDFVEDVDCDGKLEIITTVKVNSPGNTHYPGAGGGIIVLNDDGSEKMRYDSPIQNGWNGNGPDEVAMADFNGDGVRDFVFLGGGALYPYPQPLIQVIDLSGPSPVVIRNFRHDYTSSGMHDIAVADVNNDGNLDFMTSGWWCPAAAFDSFGPIIWQRGFPGGNADRYNLYTDDIDGSERPALIVGTASYSYESALYVYVVDPANGADIYSPITYPGRVRKFIPIADRVADMDGDNVNEILCWFQTQDASSDLILSASGDDGHVKWAKAGNWSFYGAQLRDANADGVFEIYIGDGNMLICVDGDGNTLWQYDLGRRCLFFDMSTKILNVDIDIKPGSYPNSINLNSKGDVPVAVFSSENFDVADIDPATLTLAGAPVKTNKKGKLMASYEDDNGDGLLDLVVHFEASELELTEESTEAVLMGETFSGIGIIGKDSVRIVH